MPIGKDSITKRVAKTTPEEKIAPELVATTAAAPAPEKKAPAKKPTSTTKKTSTAAGAKKTTSTAKKTASTAKKPAAPKAEAPVATPVEAPVETPVVETAVLTNVAPETVAAVIGHKEDEKYEKVQIGQKMPDFLL